MKMKERKIKLMKRKRKYKMQKTAVISIAALKKDNFMRDANRFIYLV